MNEINRDFYGDLPGLVCEQLDAVIIPEFSNREWFGQFWEEYRQHIKNSSMDDMLMPASYLKKYVDLDTHEDLEQLERR